MSQSGFLKLKSKDLGMLKLSMGHSDSDSPLFYAVWQKPSLNWWYNDIELMLMRWKEGHRICLQLRREQGITEELCRASFLIFLF